MNGLGWYHEGSILATGLDSAGNMRMSWDDHIKELQKRGADEACICGHDGNMWAKSAGFNASQREIATVIKAAKDEPISDDEKLELDKVPFMKIDSLKGEHTGCNLVSKNSGEKVFCCVACSNKAVVFVTKTGQHQRKAVGICEYQVKYLKDAGY
ncbi:profilin-like [Mercenaria mercenaria]|uniref:profilin-like n=1 Tax=Mercenaria mercenaria TaxID=6596 RepID=UPI00234F087A|nr:profilin-like [Mercenaria mercenaria]